MMYLFNIRKQSLIIQDLADEIKATPQRLVDAAKLKAEVVAGDIAKLPDMAKTKAVNAFNAKKMDITSRIEKKIQSLRSAVQSVFPASNK